MFGGSFHAVIKNETDMCSRPALVFHTDDVSVHTNHSLPEFRPLIGVSTRGRKPQKRLIKIAVKRYTKERDGILLVLASISEQMHGTV